MLIIKFIRYIGLVGLLSLSFLQGGCERAGLSSGIAVGKPFPELKLVTYDNEPFDIRQLKGKVVIVKLWATWCGVCREEAPKFLAFSKQLDKSVVVVSVSVDQNLNLPKEYLRDHPDDFLQLFDQAMVQAKTVLNVSMIPQVYLIDKAGVLRYYAVGIVDWNEEILKKIHDLLSE